MSTPRPLPNHPTVTIWPIGELTEVSLVERISLAAALHANAIHAASLYLPDDQGRAYELRRAAHWERVMYEAIEHQRTQRQRSLRDRVRGQHQSTEEHP